jgi:hypothetical protein
MRSKVYSAAKAFYPLHGKSKEQAWKELTNMFYPNAKKENSFIVLRHPLECVNRRRYDEISIGDIFKYSTNLSKDIYVEIVECTPYESFAYDEKWMPSSGKEVEDAYKVDSRKRMEFFLRSHPESTLVEIRRRIKGRPYSDILDVLNAAFFEKPAQRAAYQLSIILTGSDSKEDEMTVGETYIKRDDSYRIDF